ncbi:MAG: DUF4350 domain-containing protein [Pseudonocardiales bacterium]|nr:MAG: DUF4350 domain-containing protein [Pseudonocardiales bacterium]
MVITPTAPAVSADEMVRPLWHRLRLWLVFAVVVALGAVLIASLSNQPGRPLDPTSAHKNGSKALAVLLRERGIEVIRTTSLVTAARSDVGTTVLVASPTSYSTAQLAALRRSSARLVLLRPSNGVLADLGSGVQPVGAVSGPTPPGCSDAGAAAAGTVKLPDSTSTFSSDSGSTCYDGAAVIGARVVVLGSERLVRNDTVDDDGVAALDINTISDDGAARRVVWLLPGTEAAGPGAPTIWQLFPDGAHRAFGWLLVLALLLVLWRGRRLGPAVTEPLPVVVRAAEVVEGHGRLYRRAGARDRAAAALRAATLSRLAGHAGLPRRACLPDVVTSVATTTSRAANDVGYLLAGPVPADDVGLLRLAVELDELEVAAGVPPRSRGTRL